MENKPSFLDPSGQKLNPIHPIGVPFFCVPAYKIAWAHQQGVNKNIMFATWGGIGDVVCSEPTVRYALKNFKDCNISVYTHAPEVFQHLKLHDVYDARKEKPIDDDFLVFQCIPDQSVRSLIPQFISHMTTNCVDFPAISSIRSQLPIKDRVVQLHPREPGKVENQVLHKIAEAPEKYVLVHAGRHWESKTFPALWWDKVLEQIMSRGLQPVLIGKHDGETQGYVEVNRQGCVDLLDKTSLEEVMWLVQQASVLVCNDSSPMHMAAPGNAFILFVATVKHPDFISHWRIPCGVGAPEWAWRMENLSLGGIYDVIDVCPNKAENVVIDKCHQKLIESFLPDPEQVAAAAALAVERYMDERKSVYL